MRSCRLCWDIRYLYQETPPPIPPSLNHESTCRRRLRLRLHHQLRRLTLWPLAAVFALSLVLIGLIAYLFHTAQRVDHTNEVPAKISRVGKLAVDLETGVRGYRITGDAVFLEPFERVSAALPAELDALGIPSTARWSASR